MFGVSYVLNSLYNLLYSKIEYKTTNNNSPDRNARKERADIEVKSLPGSPLCLFIVVPVVLIDNLHGAR